MLYTYIDETYIKGFVPELAEYLWDGETNFDGFKEKAEQIVMNHFINRGYSAIALRPNLDLRTSTDTITTDETGLAFTDTHNRLRVGYNVSSRTGTTALVLQGSPDNTTWATIKTQSVTADGRGSFLFVGAYKYYRINADLGATSTMAYQAWLTETNFDLLLAYMWLYLILINAGKGKDNKYTEYANIFLAMYNAEWTDGKFLVDENGVVESTSGNVTFSR